MCQYSSVDGLANDWHLVHLGSRAVGGAGLIYRSHRRHPGKVVSPHRIWACGTMNRLSPCNASPFIRAQGAVAGIQLAHAGRKASTPPALAGQAWQRQSGRGRLGACRAIADCLRPQHTAPMQLDETQINEVIQAFVAAAKRALEAGFSVVEVHAAHGYLLHQFLSPLSNQRRDQYGGSFENRIRLVLEVTEAVRGVWPQRLPLFVRVSAPTGWKTAGT